MTSVICVALVALIATPRRATTVPSFFTFVGAHEYAFPHRAYSNRK
jgi:hypothetical protein